MPHGADTLLLELFAIFVWAKVFGELFEQLSLPAVLGEILAGVILGPNATALVVPSSTVASISEMGAIFLLFTVGLETRPQELIQVGKTAVNVAMAGVAAPFVLGFGYMKLIGEPTHEGIFVAAAMVATSVGITARVMADLHVLHTRVAKIILGAAVFDDILGMILLAIVAGIVTTGDVKWIHLGVLTAEAMGFALFMIYYGPRLVRRMRPGLQRMSTHDAPLILALAICLGLSVMADLHVLHTRVAKIILGAAVFDDILGMILLAIVAGIVTTGDVKWIHLGVLTAEAMGFALFMIYYGPRLVRRMRPGLQRMSTHDAPLILALAICLGLSVMASKIGMAAIIGAFFAGLIFADYSPEWNLQPRAHAINEFLAPFFFFTMGARLDPKVFTAPGVIVGAIVISFLAVISKVAGCGLPVLREGWRTFLRVGVGMTPRGEVALIVAAIGLQMNMISQRAYALVIFMTAVTTMIAPPVLRILFRVETPPPPLPEGSAAAEERVEVADAPRGP